MIRQRCAALGKRIMAKKAVASPKWLIKSDPDDYSARDLERDGETLWTGVRNALAQRHLAAMKPGDGLLIYHTGGEKAVVALGEVKASPQADPTDPTGKGRAVTIKFKSWLAAPVELSALRGDPRMATFDLIRNSRLSVMPVSAEHAGIILQMADAGGP